jgi:hypothetical protein
MHDINQLRLSLHTKAYKILEYTSKTYVKENAKEIKKKTLLSHECSITTKF